MIPPPPEKTFPVSVTNTDAREVVGRFNGIEFRFPPKKAVSVPSNVARHLFAYGLDDKAKELAVIALGWSKISTEMPAALERLKKFRFDPDEGTRLLSSPMEVERVPLAASKSEAGGKLLVA